MKLSTRTAEVFIIETDNVSVLNVMDVLTTACESKLPVVWKNYGQYRIIPSLVLHESIRLYEQWSATSSRMPGVYTFNGILHWGDCIILNDAQVMILLSGYHAFEDSDDASTDDGQS